MPPLTFREPCSVEGPQPRPSGHLETGQVPHTPRLCQPDQELGACGHHPEVPHLVKGVVGGIVKGVGGGGPGLEGEHLLLLLVQQRLHILDHDRVLDAMGLQEDFDSLEAGEWHSDIDGGARLGRAPPEVQLGRTRAGTVTAGWGGASLGKGLVAELPIQLGMSGTEDEGNPWTQDKVQYDQRNGPGSRVG